jgi:hypothetical protein
MGPWNDEDYSGMSTKKKGNGGGFNAAGLLAGAGSMANIEGGDSLNDDFKNRNKKLFSNDANRKKLEQLGFQSGNVYGMAAAAVSAAGRQVDKAAKDEYGIYSNKAGEFFDNSFDWGNGIEFWKSAVDGKQDAEGWANQLSLGLIGKSTKQRELRRAKSVFENDKVMGSIDRNKTVGANFQNNLDSYKAPAYGRAGMKIKTMFNGSKNRKEAY